MYGVTLNTWIKIVVKQALVNGDYVYSIHLNGKEIHKVTNTQPKEFHNVRVYAADPWNEALPEKIRNLVITV